MSQKRAKQIRKAVNKQAKAIKRNSYEDVVCLPFWRRVRVCWRILTRKGYSRDEIRTMQALRGF